MLDLFNATLLCLCFLFVSTYFLCFCYCSFFVCHDVVLICCYYINSFSLFSYLYIRLDLSFLYFIAGWIFMYLGYCDIHACVPFYRVLGIYIQGIYGRSY